MPNRDELIHALVELEPSAFDDVINKAYQQRYSHESLATEPPGPQATAEQFAHWLARRHLSSDAALERVVYLPTGSPADEIRLLEVNRLLNASDLGPVEPLDFTPDWDLPLKVFVADVAADQWERIKRTPESLLPGWDLRDNQIIARGQACR